MTGFATGNIVFLGMGKHVFAPLGFASIYVPQCNSVAFRSCSIT